MCADEAVIMRDGFTLRGKVFKESEAIRDLSGGQLTFPRLASFDVVEVGPKFYFYSTHSRKGAEIEKDIDRDFYMGPGQAKEYGLIDEIFEPKGKTKGDKKAEE